ncbi:Hsp33 family molecular chaperone HslO [Litoribrevibacter albus]|uniref:33 kDa chaperonin n=1 Tax=Litoribrevibacter albus TaxID=1473156 RepID=A0AA37SAV5_9GAMM|nr:Hsp33 family molecular chaperone HslO [Litoribrevibacter albus]GLQ32542.1 33 kDa chaperonin [Litoribrevibacter albus]
MSNSDQIQRFMFEHHDIRGELVGLDEAYQAVINKHDYADSVKILLGEWMAAASLLSQILKFEGSVILQARGAEGIGLLMAECTHKQQIRAIAQVNGDVTTTSIKELFGAGHLVITIQPSKGSRYQGIVPMDSDSLAECLEHYFQQSEQLPTRIWLQADRKRAAGLFLQKLPTEQDATDSEKEESDNQWQHAVTLADTIKAEELLNLDNETILHRLYHEEDIRLFDIEDIEFHCTCSRERTAESIKTVGKEELLSILEEEPEIKVTCQFCNETYRFDQVDVIALFEGTHSGEGQNSQDGSVH